MSTARIRSSALPAPDHSPAALAARVRETLGTLGISERELARRGGFAAENHVNTLLRRLDAGQTIGVDTLVDLARGAGRSVEWMATGVDPDRGLCDACRRARTAR